MMVRLLDRWQLKHPKSPDIPLPILEYCRIENSHWCRTYSQNEKQLVLWVRALNRGGHEFGKRHIHLAKNVARRVSSAERTLLEQLRAAFVEQFGTLENVIKAVKTLRQPARKRRKS